MILSFWTDKSGQTAKEQSDQVYTVSHFGFIVWTRFLWYKHIVQSLGQLQLFFLSVQWFFCGILEILDSVQEQNSDSEIIFVNHTAVFSCFSSVERHVFTWHHIEVKALATACLEIKILNGILIDVYCL